MDWQLRTWSGTAGSTKRWVSHSGHDGPAPHGLVERVRIGGRTRGLVVATEPGSRLIKLDGSSGEGGGQILRTALSLSMLTGRAFRIVKIRANRDKPGLRPQHATAVEAAAMLCDAEVTGGSVGSRDLTFRPGTIRPRDLSIDIGTAGATSLVLQTLHLPIALRAESGVRLALTGGTYNLAAPSFPFLATTWRAHLAAIGMPVSLSMPSAGHFPQGGGRLEAWIEPGQPRPLVLEDRGELVKIRGVVETTNLPEGIARRIADRVLERLVEQGLLAEIEFRPTPGPGQGVAVALVAESAGAPPATFVGLGQRGKPTEAVADEAVEELLAHLAASEGAVDPHSADQVLVPLAFAEGRSVYTVSQVTEHLRTNARTIQAFLDRSIRVEESAEGPGGRVIVG